MPRREIFLFRLLLLLPLLFALFPLALLPLGGDLVAAPSGGEKDEIEKLIREGKAFLEGRRFPEAAAKLDLAFRRGEALGDLRLEAESLALLGTVAEGLGDLPLAEERYARALEFARKAGDRALEAKVHERAGDGCRARGENAAAIERYRTTLAIRKQLGDLTGESAILDSIGWVHLKQGAFREARTHFDRALDGAIASRSRPLQAFALRSLGILEREQGDFRAATERLEESLQIWKELQSRRHELETINEIGITYAINSAPAEALSWYSRALELAAALGDLDREASALFSMGRAHYRMKRGAEAIECFRKALAIRERFQDREKQGWCLQGIGDVHFMDRDIEAAVSHYLRAVECWEKVGARRALASLLVDLGGAYLEKGDEESAKASFERALRSGEEIALPYRSTALLGLARIHGGRREREEALTLADQAVAMARESGILDLLWTSAYRQGLLQRQLGQRDAAFRSFEESLDAIETLRRQSIPEDGVKTAFLDDKQSVYEEAIGLALELKRPEAALLIAERARARSFIDLLSGREIESSRPGDEEVLREVRKLDDGSRGDAQKPAARLATLRREQPELVSLTYVPPPSLDGLRQEAISRKATIVEYFLGREALSIWVVKPDGAIECARSPAGRREIERIVQGMREDLNRNLEKSDPLPALRRLYELLVEPVEDRLPKDAGELVIIVPHGELFLVSFAALLDRGGRFFIERHKLALAPSTGVLEYTRRKKERVIHAAAPRLLAVGNPRMPERGDPAQPLGPLPGAEEEVEALARRFPAERLTVLTGERARKSLFRTLSPGQTVIHLATHAVLREDPLASSIALAPEGDGDSGLLTVREVFGLDLHADLVVLSACNTALGRISGDGVIGLSRAFIHAGAASVLVSLWRVEDLTARLLMDDFYGALEKYRGDKAAALREAQLRLLERLRKGEVRLPGGRPLRPHPIYWAPFVLVGEPS